MTVAVSLADKLDTLAGFFGVHEKPTGSKDPFALRRAALAVIRLIITNELSAPLQSVVLKASRSVFAYLSTDQVERASKAYLEIEDYLDNSEEADKVVDGIFESAKRRAFVQNLYNESYRRSTSIDLLDFFADRLKVQQREAGVRHDLIDAVFALGGEDDLVRLLARVKALQAFVGTDAGANLLAGYKRAGNILKSSPSGGGEPAKLVEGHSEGASPSDVEENLAVPLHHPADGSPPRSGEELALQSALDTAEPLATAAIAREDFEGAMSALSTLRAPIDAFFEGVMVNDPDPQKRAYRLGLLERFVSAVHRVADFSKIEG